MVGTRITGRGSRRLSRRIRVTDSTIRIGSVQRLAFNVLRLAFGAVGAVGTRSRAIRRNKSMKLRIQALDRLPAVLFDNVLFGCSTPDRARARPYRAYGAERRRTPNVER